MVRLAGLADLHVEETSVQPYRDLFAEISQRADVLALCGDLTNLGKVREAEILAQDLRSCTIPVVGVLGNHDHESGQPQEVVRILQDAGLHFLESQTHELAGLGFAGVKGFGGGFGTRMLSAFGEEAIKRFVAEAVDEAMRLENALRMIRSERRVVVLHYSPITATLAGEVPELFPFLGSSRLAETIDRYQVSAVLHGHAHHGTYGGATGRGIPVYNCARHVAKENGRPYALIEI
jgi:Icc-related predicted phosphoesterase